MKINVRIKEKSTIIFILLVALLPTFFLFQFLITQLPGNETIEFKFISENLSWNHYNQGAVNEHFILQEYSFSLDEVRIKDLDWRWSTYSGIALFIEILFYDANNTYVDHLGKTSLWEGLAIWDGSWNYTIPIINLSPISPIYSTSFKLETYITFRYRLISYFFGFTINEFRLLAGEIYYEG